MLTQRYRKELDDKEKVVPVELTKDNKMHQNFRAALKYINFLFIPSQPWASAGHLANNKVRENLQQLIGSIKREEKPQQTIG